nr:hypothetical protein 1634Bnrm2_p162 [Cryptomonas sp.]
MFHHKTNSLPSPPQKLNLIIIDKFFCIETMYLIVYWVLFISIFLKYAFFYSKKRTKKIAKKHQRSREIERYKNLIIWKYID